MTFDFKVYYALYSQTHARTTCTYKTGFNLAQWKSRVAALHAYWETHMYERDKDITPLMYASSLLPGAWLPKESLRVRHNSSTDTTDTCGGDSDSSATVVL
jgi:hypothetical protein